jgi:hypothetical protein
MSVYSIRISKAHSVYQIESAEKNTYIFKIYVVCDVEYSALKYA